MMDSLVSRLGVSSRNPMTVCTIRVIACLSWPCFLDSTKVWSLSKLQLPAFLQIVMMAINIRDVEARSEA